MIREPAARIKKVKWIEACEEGLGGFLFELSESDKNLVP